MERYVINPDDKKIKGINWLSLFIYGCVSDDDSIMCGFYCIAFIEYMLAWKTLLDLLMTIERMIR